MRIDIYFIRHGLSCANLVKKFSRIPFKHTTYSDPELSTAGQAMTILNGRSLRTYFRNNQIHIDLVGSSVLVRAIETSYYLFNSDRGRSMDSAKTIYALPFIAEVGMTLDNIASSVKDQLSVLRHDEIADAETLPVCPIGKKCVLDFSQVLGEGRSSSNYTKFITWLAQNLDWVLQQSAGEEDNLTMALVTHSHFLQKELKTKGPVRNNEVYHVTLKMARVGLGQWILVSKSAPDRIDYGIRDDYPSQKQGYCPDRCRKYNVCT